MENEIEFKSKNKRQIEAISYWIDKETEEILYGGAKGGGKSYLGASVIFGDALIYPETHYFIARKELNDLRKRNSDKHIIASFFSFCQSDK